jgi:hypothetical protein
MRFWIRFFRANRAVVDSFVGGAVLSPDSIPIVDLLSDETDSPLGVKKTSGIVVLSSVDCCGVDMVGVEIAAFLSRFSRARSDKDRFSFAGILAGIGGVSFIRLGFGAKLLICSNTFITSARALALFRGEIDFLYRNLSWEELTFIIAPESNSALCCAAAPES